MKLVPIGIFLWIACALWAVYAGGDSGETIELELCSAKTCNPVLASGVQRYGTRAILQAKSIAAISNIDNCPNCTKLIFENVHGQAVIVMGNPEDWKCKIWGGMHCVMQEQSKQND